MKAKMIKFTIPAMAILFAIAASAFTVLEKSNTDANVPLDAYIQTGNPSAPCQEVQVDDCQLSGEMDCEYEIGVPAYRNDGDTVCSFQLSKIPE
ncbi:MAG: DUF6520 family protein [Flagellimonas sp.]